ncbi:MAG: 4Fe-4S binding protein [Deltaproteobacteria bacterium]|nr:4Fe-4S binding protein [Deltaproteobacteria bacterium]
MLKTLRARLQQGHRTIAFPAAEPELVDRFRGRPALVPAKCRDGCRECAAACPTQALTVAGGLQLDLGRCLFCAECASVCPEGAIQFTGEYRLATRTRVALQLAGPTFDLAQALGEELRRLLGRSLKLRQVSAGGCNACEAEVNVLNTVVFDLGRFGVQFVASPRHADGLLITGPVTENMRLALHKTYEAVPAPKVVIAVGACAISGGPFRDHPEQHNGAEGVLPIDLYVPGCPPHPVTILDGLLRLLGQR